MKKLLSTYEAIVVGSNLNGLLAAQWLVNHGYSVAILEAKAQTGGGWRSGMGVPWAANSEKNKTTAQWLQQEFFSTLSWHEVEQAPQTFQNNNWQPFLGFGDSKFRSTDVLAQLSNSNMLQTNLYPDDLVESLLNNPKLDIHTLSEVTALAPLPSGGVSVTVNGEAQTVAHRVFFSPTPIQLDALMPGELLAAKIRQRLARATWWGGLFLHFESSATQYPESGLNVLFGSGENFEPCVGRMRSGGGSLWFSPIHHEQLEDVDHISSVMKYMKRQIKRGYPEYFNGEVRERIRLIGACFGPLPEVAIPQIHVISGLLSAGVDWLESLSPLQIALEAVRTQGSLANPTAATSKI